LIRVGVQTDGSRKEESLSKKKEGGEGKMVSFVGSRNGENSRQREPSTERRFSCKSLRGAMERELKFWLQ